MDQLTVPTGYGGVVLAGVGSWDELTWCSSRLLIGDVISCDVCGRWLPGEGDGGGGERCEMEAGGSLDHWFVYGEKYHVRSSDC